MSASIIGLLACGIGAIFRAGWGAVNLQRAAWVTIDQKLCGAR
jgi:hypothetical protein